MGGSAQYGERTVEWWHSIFQEWAMSWRSKAHFEGEKGEEGKVCYGSDSSNLSTNYMGKLLSI